MSDHQPNAPPRPRPAPAHAGSLAYLRKQAKQLLRAYRTGDRAAIVRLSAVHPHLRGTWNGVPRPDVGLAEAQHTLARELGYPSWPRLKRALASGAASSQPIDIDHDNGDLRMTTTTTNTTTSGLGLSAIDQISLSCTDLDAAQRFYVDVLGLRYAGEVPDHFKFFDCNGVNIIMSKGDRPGSIFYFKVPGVPGLIQEKVARLRELGVDVQQDAHRIAENWNGFDVYLAFFKDPFGNLMSMKSDVPVGKK
jgi:catechol 2,3-dioxygenase-like lactoylglutathione lyase family enzyme